ncbi:MAG: hypothetical protein JWP30_1309 [Homoserinimonas sp.]|nr:hypothetical protein [Mycetocola sp.]MCU1546209.1 hypothetical protein [Homoserinimonas sp.]
MNDIYHPNGGHESQLPRRSAQLVSLSVLLFAEAGALAAAAVYLVVELLVDVPSSYPAAIFVLLLAILACVWVGLIAVNALRGASWIRGAAVVWQVLQVSLGVGSMQGIFARPDIGWLLIIPALVVLVLLFTRPVLQATMRRE